VQKSLGYGIIKSLGYGIIPLKVRSAISEFGFEMPFDIGLRTSLRLGDSCLIIGEIRSKEAKVLYEAMRIGAMSNIVAGTIHADTPYGVYDRVVNDLGVPQGSFKVTDLIIIVNQIKLPGALKRVRRVLKVTEVLKEWSNEPKFQDLLVWNPNTDELEPTEALLNKSVMLNQIMNISRGYSNYNDIIKEIKLRSWAKQTHVLFAKYANMLEAKYVLTANIAFAKLFEKILPLKSEKNMEQFKKEFTQIIKNIFSTSIGSKTVAGKAKTILGDEHLLKQIQRVS